MFGLQFSMRRSDSSSRYELLSHSPKQDSEDVVLENRLRDSPRKKWDTISWVVAVCTLCTIANILLSTVAHNQPYFEPMLRKDIGRLKRPSQFIGLDKVKRPIPPIPRKFVNYPTLLKQVSRSEPRKVFDDSPNRHRNGREKFTPNDRSVNMTTDLSTIAEFRAIDYGMERCELTLMVPRVNETSTTFNSTLILGDRLNRVDLWRLESPYSLDSQELSWSNRPPRKEKLASYDIDYNNVYRFSFDCLSDSLHVFEFAGSSPDCRVEWWQDHNIPSPGILMTQYATK